ncbi:MAG: carbamoyl phosphate synthase, partial [Lentisphaeria bacterium]|nr:carbamoyl phosphate synthase [Lentisphaeria bacterium]
MNICFINAGRRIELIAAFRRSLNGLDTIIATDISDSAPALFHADKSVLLPHGDKPEFFDALIKLLLKEKVDLLIPSIDPDLERGV